MDIEEKKPQSSHNICVRTMDKSEVELYVNIVIIKKTRHEDQKNDRFLTRVGALVIRYC